MLSKHKSGKKKTTSYKQDAPKIAFARKLRLLFRKVAILSSVAVVFMLVVASGWGWYSGRIHASLYQYYNDALGYTASLGLKVTDVFLEGEEYTGSTAILKALAVKRGSPIFSIDLDDAKERLEALEWVRYASIERQLPSALHVHIIERTPLALWQHKGKVRLVDQDGEVIRGANIKTFAELPIVVGEDAATQAPYLLRLLSEEEGLEIMVVSAVRVGQRRWNLQLSNNIEIFLPESGMQQALHNLAKLQEETNILESNISAIDLRLPEKISIQHEKNKQSNG